MPEELHHITHTHNTHAILDANLNNDQSAIETDSGFMAYRDDGGVYHLLANQGEAMTYADITCDDLVIATGHGLTITDMTQGSVLFAGVGGVVSQDNSKFFWNNSSKFLGIGTASPLAELDIGAGKIAISSSGVNTIPAFSTTLVIGEISGVHTTLASDSGFLRLSAGGGGSVVYKSGIDIQGYGSVDDTQIRMYTAGTERLRIYSTGNVYVKKALFVGNVDPTVHGNIVMMIGNATSLADYDLDISSGQNAYGFYVYPHIKNSANNATNFGGNMSLRVNADGTARTVTDAITLGLGAVDKDANAIITNATTLKVFLPTDGTTLNRGLWITGGSAAATNYSLRNDSAAQSYFAGKLGIATTAPLAELDISAGKIVIDSTGVNTIPSFGTSLVAGEISGVHTTLSSDSGFLRLSAGGGGVLTNRSGIDIQGYGSVDGTQIRMYVAAAAPVFCAKRYGIGFFTTDIESYYSTYYGIELGDACCINWSSGHDLYISQNAYQPTTASFKRKTAAAVSQHVQTGGTHAFKVAATSTLDSEITWITGLSIAVTGLVTIPSLTSGRVAYTTTSSLLTDSTSLKFDGSLLGIGLGATAMAGAIDAVSTNGNMLLGTNATDNTNKNLLIGMRHYDVDEEPFYCITGATTTSANNVYIGGGSALGNAATSIFFQASADNTTVGGTTRLTITSALITAVIPIQCGEFSGIDCATNNAYFKPQRTSSATTPPTLAAGELRMWYNSDGEQLYLMYNDATIGTKKVLLT